MYIILPYLPYRPAVFHINGKVHSVFHTAYTFIINIDYHIEIYGSSSVDLKKPPVLGE